LVIGNTPVNAARPHLLPWLPYATECDFSLADDTGQKEKKRRDRLVGMIGLPLSLNLDRSCKKMSILYYQCGAEKDSPCERLVGASKAIHLKLRHYAFVGFKAWMAPVS
jgi:hypothetical protein